MKGFINFIREQGVVGLAIGFILGGSISKLVSSLVNDLINPLVGLMVGPTGNLKSEILEIGSTKIMYGNFLSAFIDFAIIAAIVFFGFKMLRLEQLDKKKT
jgi:large conductance mechanosensitive channel